MIQNGNLIKEFFEINSDGKRIGIKLKYPIEREGAPEDIVAFINNPSRKGLAWIYEGADIIIRDENVSVHGLPSVNLNYVVAIYDGLTGKHTTPNNAVIYNLDGSVHKILQIPAFISEITTKRLSLLNMPNPPLDWAKFEGGLSFGGFAWRDVGNGLIVDSVVLEMDKGSYEIRALDVEEGNLGECLDAGLAMYSRY